MQHEAAVKGEPTGDFLTRSRQIKHPWLRRIWHFLMVFGPGLIVMEADNDAGAVATYTQAGGLYGTKLLWVLFLLLPVTYFCQEMVVRLGVATGKGQAAMIYRRFGKWWGRFSLFNLEVVNFLTLITEFAAISMAFSAMGIAPYVSVPLSAIALVVLVVSGSYLRWERLTIFLCLLDIVWVAVMVLSRPKIGEAVHDTLIPSMPIGGITSSLVFFVIAVVGTTVAPWQLFFQQSCIADKKLRFTDLKWAQLDTFVGAVFTIVVAGAMMLAGDALFRQGIKYEDPAQMARALAPTIGEFGKNAILLLMVNAAVLGTTAISLASAWAFGEVAGWEHSLHKKVREAPKFYAVYIGAVAAAAGIVLIPGVPLQLIVVAIQALAGLILPSAIIFVQLLLNDKELLGQYANKPWNNVINWTIIIVLLVLSGVLAVQVLVPNADP